MELDVLETLVMVVHVLAALACGGVSVPEVDVPEGLSETVEAGACAARGGATTRWRPTTPI